MCQRKCLAGKPAIKIGWLCRSGIGLCRLILCTLDTSTSYGARLSSGAANLAFQTKLLENRPLCNFSRVSSTPHFATLKWGRGAIQKVKFSKLDILSAGAVERVNMCIPAFPTISHKHNTKLKPYITNTTIPKAYANHDGDSSNTTNSGVLAKYSAEASGPHSTLTFLGMPSSGKMADTEDFCTTFSCTESYPKV
jgi:hypothetical protein